MTNKSEMNALTKLGLGEVMILFSPTPLFTRGPSPQCEDRRVEPLVGTHTNAVFSRFR
jgi:hypothetical protein